LSGKAEPAAELFRPKLPAISRESQMKKTVETPFDPLLEFSDGGI
jgi:hypothetical protein